MLQCLLLSKIEFILLIIAECVLFVHFKIAKYDTKKAVLWCILFIPMLYFSINMVTEAVTVDEPGYEICITDVRNLKYQGKAEAVLYEYKLAQLTVGTIFLLIPSFIKESLGENGIWMLYKIIHWLFIYILALATVNVWRKWILVDKDEKWNRIAENSVLAIMIGLPLSCLLIKVTNYDAGSTYPAIFGVSILWAAYKTQNRKMGFWATVITAFAVMDKWTALPYWVISVILFALIVIKNEKKYIGKIKGTISATILAFVGAMGISVFYFLYAFFQQGGFYRKIDLGVITFSFTHAVRAVITSNWTVSSSNLDIIFIVPLVVLIIACVLSLDFFASKLFKSVQKASNVYLKVDSVLIILGIMGGVVAAYFIPLRISPYLPIQEGFYVTTDSFDGWTYHFSAKTAIGHFGAKLCYMCATICTNYPTILLLLFLIICIFLLKKSDFKEIYFCSILLSAAIGLLILYAVVGLPYDAKYYSYSIYVLALTLIYLGYYCLNFSMANRVLLSVGILVYYVEMALYIPNIKPFSPVWLWHDSEWNKSIRVGEWSAGETMFWGEEMAIAGCKIDFFISETNDEINEITIYSNYGVVWPGNPGYKIRSIYETDLEFGKNDYYVLNKFKLFRADKPEFINRVTPIATINYKGEVGAWIYRGEDLKDYTDYFVKETGNRIVSDGE